MIKIIDVVDELIEYCFGDDLKEVLEVPINGHVITVKSQFLFHYKRACYRGTLDELKQVMLYKIHLNYDLIVKIKDYQDNIQKIVDVDEYGIVKRNYHELLGSDGTVSAFDTSESSASKEVGNVNNIDTSSNIGVSSVKSGVSETNELHDVNKVITNPTIKDYTQSMDKYNLENDSINSTKENVQFKTLIHEDSTDKVKYQHFTNQLNTDNHMDSSNSKSSQSTLSKTIDRKQSLFTKTKGVKRDESKWQVEYITNDARIRAWTLEIPKLKQKFWNIFHWLFIYESF